MDEDDLQMIEQQAEIAARTGGQVSLSGLDVMALVQAVREAYRAGAELQRQRDLAFSQLQTLQEHLAAIQERLGKLGGLVGGP